MWIAIVGLAKKGLPTADSCPEGPKCVGLCVSVSMENHNLYHPIQKCSVSGGEKVSAGSTYGYTNVGSKGRHARRAISYRMNN